MKLKHMTTLGFRQVLAHNNVDIVIHKIEDTKYMVIFYQHNGGVRWEIFSKLYDLPYYRKFRFLPPTGSEDVEKLNRVYVQRQAIHDLFNAGFRFFNLEVPPGAEIKQVEVNVPWEKDS